MNGYGDRNRGNNRKRDYKNEKDWLNRIMPWVLIVIATIGAAVVFGMLLTKLFGGATKGIVN